MKKILRISLVLALVFLFSMNIFAFEEWDVFSEEDEMEGTAIWFAVSPPAEATREMSFPYQETRGRLYVAYDGDEPWAYFSFTETPNLTGTKIHDGYDTFTNRIRWDGDEDKIEDASFSQSWGSDSIHFINTEGIVDKIKEGQELLLELNWYGEDSVYFDFCLKESEEAIDEIYKSFEE